MSTIKSKKNQNNTAYNEVLKLIAIYRFVTINQLRAILAVRKYFQARKILFDLWNNGYLERLILTKAAQKISFSYVFALSRKGARQLTLFFGLDRSFYLKPNDTRSTVFLEHTILINSFRICLECAIKKRSEFELTSWKQLKQQVKVNLN